MTRFYVPYPHDGFKLMENRNGVEADAVEAGYLDSQEIWFAIHLVDYDDSGKLVASIIKHGQQANAEAGHDRILANRLAGEA